MQHRLKFALLSVALLLSGCDLAQRFASPEERINAEMPLSVALRQARERLAEQLSPGSVEHAALDKTWATRLRARALSCSPDFTPSWKHSRAEIQVGVKDKACFAEFDRKLLRWIGLQRLRLALAMPPLGVPAEGAAVHISPALQGMHLQLPRDAGQAAVLALQTAKGFELIALDDGRSLFKDPNPVSELSVAPNGRVFAESSAGVLRLRMSDGGETLLELQQARSITWLGKELLAVRGSDGSAKPVYLLNLQRGDEVALPQDNLTSRSTLLPVPGMENRFNAVSHMGAYQYEYADRDGSATIALVASKPGMNGALAMFDAALPTSDQQWVLANRRLYRFNPKSLDIQETSFEPVHIANATPTSEPDQFVVHLSLPVRANSAPSRNGHYLFDTSKGTLARLEGPAAQTPLRYLPAVKRFAQMPYGGIQLVESLQTGPAEPADQVIAALLDEANQLVLAQATPPAPAATAIAADRFRSDASASMGVDPQLGALARDAQIEGVGIYEGRERLVQPGPMRGAGKVQVTVRRSSRPIILVLSAYDPVQWNIQLEPGARLAAVLLSSYHEGSVEGLGSARLLRIGRTAVYKQDDERFAELQGQVRRWTGKPISLFQGLYTGSRFSVGGQ